MRRGKEEVYGRKADDSNRLGGRTYEKTESYYSKNERPSKNYANNYNASSYEKSSSTAREESRRRDRDRSSERYRRRSRSREREREHGRRDRSRDRDERAYRRRRSQERDRDRRHRAPEGRSSKRQEQKDDQRSRYRDDDGAVERRERSLERDSRTKIEGDKKVRLPSEDRKIVEEIIRTLLCEFPALKDELPAVFSAIQEGNAVSLDAMEDKVIQRGLAIIFDTLGLKEGEDGYSLRSDQVLPDFEYMFIQDESGNASEQTTGYPVLPRELVMKPEATQRDGANPEAFVREADDDEREPTNADGERILGPTLPPKGFFSRHNDSDNNDSDEDDAYGPSLVKSMRDFASTSSAAMQISTAPWAVTGKPDDDATEAKRSGREDWMVSPGLLGGIFGGSSQSKTAKGGKVERTTSAGSQSSSLAVRGSSGTSSAEKRSSEFLDEYNKQHRSKSLMELFQEKKKSEQAAAALDSKGKGGSEKFPRAFDREKDLIVKRTISVQDAMEMIGSVDDMFSRAKVQRFQ